jgi:hypothetical protein
MSRPLCPNCHALALATYDELPEDERYIANQRPSPDDPSIEHRQKNHLWCRRCWFEHCPRGDVLVV